MSRAILAVEQPAIGGLLRLAWQLVRERIYDGVCRQGYDDLNPAHLAMFRYEGLDGRRPVEIADSMQITKQSVNDLLRHLERRGYVELTVDPNDSRARLIHLTPNGRRLDSVVRDQARRVEENWARELGSRRFREFRKILAKMATWRRTSSGAIASESKKHGPHGR
jgi:DNA-binding MarR family transcriptional regulator